MLAHLEVFSTLGGVFRVPLLIWGTWGATHIRRVDVGVVAWVISTVPSSSSHSGLRTQEKMKSSVLLKHSFYRPKTPEYCGHQALPVLIISKCFQLGKEWLSTYKAAVVTSTTPVISSSIISSSVPLITPLHVALIVPRATLHGSGVLP